MPRNTRNFWITTYTDARAKPVGTGPLRKDGGFSTEILIRQDGCISNHRLRIYGVVVDGVLEVRADPPSGQCAELGHDSAKPIVLLRGQR